MGSTLLVKKMGVNPNKNCLTPPTKQKPSRNHRHLRASKASGSASSRRALLWAARSAAVLRSTATARAPGSRAARRATSARQPQPVPRSNLKPVVDAGGWMDLMDFYG